MKLELSSPVSLADLLPHSKGDIKINMITTDSRHVQPGSLFVAISGKDVDGHQFVTQAHQRGAAVCLVEKDSGLGDRQLVVKDTRIALAKIAEEAAGRPTESIKVAGITGTNGKTTINWLVYNALLKLGHKAVRSGTLGIFSEGLVNIESLTTADPLTLHGIFRDGLAQGVNYAVLEVSSHGLSQERTRGVRFDTAIYTNLTRDHLDYHKTFEDYYQAKAKLFLQLEDQGKGARLAVVNKDCPYGKRLISEGVNKNTITYGRDKTSDIFLDLKYQDYKKAVTLLRIDGMEYEIPTTFFGLHNSYNLAAACGAMLGLGFKPAEAVNIMSDLPSVPGRLEFIPGNEFSVFVDYAHTPDALENVITAVRPLVKGSLWVIFGCGGDRDPGKRPIMGKIACAMADQVVVTSDNPRTEDPQTIINDILAGCKPQFVEPDRRKAIRLAISSAKPGDIVLIAGKGHEDYQIIGKTKTHFSDQEETRAALTGMNPVS